MWRRISNGISRKPVGLLESKPNLPLMDCVFGNNSQVKALEPKDGHGINRCQCQLLYYILYIDDCGETSAAFAVT